MGASLAVTAVVALLYLLVVRLLDFNEKEPMWAVLMLFAFGAGSATLLLVVAPGGFVDLSPLSGGVAIELARFIAIGAGVGVLTLIGRSKGYSEINGLLDGVVYGSAGGFGFATGLSFTQEIVLPTPDLPLAMGTVGGYGEVALVGLSDGLFGALVGIGFAAALEARSVVKRAAAGVLGLVAAVGGHLLYDLIAKGAPFSDAAVTRKWVALLLPVFVVVAVVIVALRYEKGAISELDGEVETGAVTPDDLDLLQSFMAREAAYMRRLLRFDVRGWSALHSLHNRQVQLALAKRKASRESDDEARQDAAAEVAALRRSVLELKAQLDTPRATEGGT
jgi:protease PrsW